MRPVPGSVYEVVRQFTVQSGKTYEPGMHLELYEETTEKPFGFESRISNWIVKCPFFAPRPRRRSGPRSGCSSSKVTSGTSAT